MIFNEWRHITKPAYIVVMFILFLLPLGAGYLAALIDPWSSLWWELTQKLFYLWVGWTLFCAIFGLHNKRFARLFPIILILSVAFALTLVILWRVTGELEMMAWILFVSYWLSTGFAYVYSKPLIQKSVSSINLFGKCWLIFVAVCPVIWIIYTIAQGEINSIPNVIQGFGMGICFYFIHIYLVCTSMKFRDPNWEPDQDQQLGR